MIPEDVDIFPEPKEKIKLMKMSKGYNWEVTILDLDLDRLDKINSELVRRYGDKNGNS